jgi:hypothetical protein
MTARMEKISVSIDTREVAWARKQAKALGTSLSAVLTDALRRQRKLAAMDRLLAELGTDDITEEELLAVHAERVG